MSSEEQVISIQHASDDRTVSDGSAEDEEEHGINDTHRQGRPKKDKALIVASALIVVGMVASAIAVFRPGGPGNLSVQSSQGQIFNTFPTFAPSPYYVDIFEGATSFGAGEGTGNKPNSGGGSGKLPPPFMETPFPMETPIPTPMPSSYAGTESPTSVATGMGSGQGTETVSTETTGPPTLPNRDSA